jgi:Transposase IS66 family
MSHWEKPAQNANKKRLRSIIDLLFTKNGCKKVIIKYEANKGYCSSCNYSYNPLTASRSGFIPDQVDRFKGGQVYGHGFRSWIVYQRLCLRLPYELIAQHIEDLFHERVNPQTIATTVIYFASYYHETEEKLIQNLLKSPFIHIDETEINIEYTKQYVWIFSDGIHVVFKLTETREADIVHDFLGNYDGIVISDYPTGSISTLR